MTELCGLVVAAVAALLPRGSGRCAARGPKGAAHRKDRREHEIALAGLLDPRRIVRSVKSLIFDIASARAVEMVGIGEAPIDANRCASLAEAASAIFRLWLEAAICS